MPTFPSFAYNRNTGVQNSLPPYLSGFQDYSQLGQPGMSAGTSPFQRPPNEPSFVMGQPQAGRDAMASFMQRWGPNRAGAGTLGQPQAARDAMASFMERWGPNRTRFGNFGRPQMTTNPAAQPYPDFAPIPIPQARSTSSAMLAAGAPPGTSDVWLNGVPSNSGGIPFDDVGLLRQWQQQRGVQVMPRF